MLSIFIATFLIISCTTNPITSKKHFNVIPESLEQSMGIQAYQQVLSTEKISKDQVKNDLVKRVGRRIASVSQTSDYEWEFTVIESDQQNAFCLPGGKVAVYTGILPIAKNEAGLAIVLGHEVTHAIARHGGKRMTQNLALLGGLTTLQGTLLRNNPQQTLIMQLLGVGATLGVALPFSRSDETEADETGQILMARAGYDPLESVAFWERFEKAASGKSVPEFLSTHPNPGNRAQNLRSKMAKAQKEYAAAPYHYGSGNNFNSPSLKSDID